MLNTNASWHLRATLISLGLMLSLPFLLPWHFDPIRTFYQECLAAALGIAGLTWLVRDVKNQALEVPEIAFLPIGLLLIAALQAAFQPAALPERLLIFSLYMIWASLLMILGRRLADQNTGIGLSLLSSVLATAITLGALLQAGCGLMQLSNQATGPLFFQLIPGSGLTGNIAQQNNFADHLWLGIAAILHLWVRRQIGTSLTLFTLILLIPTSLLSTSRSVWLYLIALLLINGVWKNSSSDKSHTYWRQGCFMALGITVLAQTAFSLEILPLPESLSNSGARLANQGYDAVRVKLWAIAWETFQDNPWLGAGVGLYPLNFLIRMERYAPLPDGVAEHAHNILFNLLAEMGIVAAMLCLVLCARWLIQQFKSEASSEQRWLMGSFAILGIHSNLEYPLWYGFFLGLAALLAGAGSLRNHKLRPSSGTPFLLAGIIGLGSISIFRLQEDYRILETTLNGWAASTNEAERQALNSSALVKLTEASLLRPYIFQVAARVMNTETTPLKQQRLICDQALRHAPEKATKRLCNKIPLPSLF